MTTYWGYYVLAALIVSPTGISAAGSTSDVPLAKLAGSWKGTGVARFEGGQTERLTCRGYYSAKSGGKDVGLALRCASSAAKIDLRSNLHVSSGNVSGTWEERTFNAAGNLSGNASTNRLKLKIVGNGLSASLSMSFSTSSHSVVIDATGLAFKGVKIEMRRL